MQVRTLVAAVALVAGLACGRAAEASCPATVPNIFTNSVSIVDATTTNANNATLIACASNVDNTQIGSAGIYASQIVSTGISTGTFGGSSGANPFSFGPLSVNTQVPLTIVGSTAPSVDLFDVVNNSRATKYFYITSTGAATFGVAPVGPNGGTFLDTSSTAQTKTGSLNVNGITLPLSSAAAPATNQLTIGVDGSGYANLNNQNVNGFKLIIQGTTYATLAGNGVFTAAGLSLSGLTGGPTITTDTVNTQIRAYSATGAIIMTNYNGSAYSPAYGGAGGYFPPVYNASGAALASTTHIVVGSLTTTLSSSCTGGGGNCSLATNSVTFSGNGVFASAPYCTANALGSYAFAVGTNATTTGVTFTLTTSITQSSPPNVVINYQCTGA